MTFDPPKPRQAEPSDVDEVVRLAELMFASIGHDLSDGWRAAAAREFVEMPDAVAFVVDHPEEPRRLVSSAAASIATRLPVPKNPSGRVGYVQWVATEPEYRGRGLSTAVLRELLRRLDGQGVGKVELHATDAGFRVYEGLGFATPKYPAMETYRRLPHR